MRAFHTWGWACPLLLRDFYPSREGWGWGSCPLSFAVAAFSSWGVRDGGAPAEFAEGPDNWKEPREASVMWYRRKCPTSESEARKAAQALFLVSLPQIQNVKVQQVIWKFPSGTDIHRVWDNPGCILQSSGGGFKNQGPTQTN